VRDPDYIGGRIFSNVFVALIVGTLFYQMVPDQKGLLSRGGLLFLIVLNTFFSSQAMIPINIKARETYFREVSSNMYSALSYYLARTLADLPFVALQTFLFCTIIYWFSGLTDDNHGAHYGLLLSAMFFVTGMGYGFGEFCASIAPNMELATGIFTVVAIIQMLFTGFLILPDAIPVGWRFLYYFNLFRYPLNYLFINELKSQPYFCSPGEAIPTGNPGEFSCQFQSGDRYLEFIGINPSDGDLFFGLTVLFFGFVRVLGYLSLRYVNYVKR
jgi:ATP-binding cassette subfamily G (WHITE) protein 2 (SNQ2)